MGLPCQIFIRFDQGQVLHVEGEWGLLCGLSVLPRLSRCFCFTLVNMFEFRLPSLSLGKWQWIITVPCEYWWYFLNVDTTDSFVSEIQLRSQYIFFNGFIWFYKKKKKCYSKDFPNLKIHLVLVTKLKFVHIAL